MSIIFHPNQADWMGCACHSWVQDSNCPSFRLQWERVIHQPRSLSEQVAIGEFDSSCAWSSPVPNPFLYRGTIFRYQGQQLIRDLHVGFNRIAKCTNQRDVWHDHRSA